MRIKHLLFVTTVALAVTTTPAMAKKRPQMSSLELQQIQSREYESDKNMVFGSVMTVLQDSGYRIGSADKDTGLITGLGSTSSKLTWKPFAGFGRGKKTPIVSAFIEELVPGYTKVRLSFVMGKVNSSGYGKNEDEKPVLDAQVYRDAFEKIDQVLFYRRALLDRAKPIEQGQSQQEATTPVESISSDAQTQGSDGVPDVPGQQDVQITKPDLRR